MATRASPTASKVSSHHALNSSGRCSTAPSGARRFGGQATIELTDDFSFSEEHLDTAAEVQKLEAGVRTSLDLEKSQLLLKGREPSNEEIMAYLDKHKLQPLVTDIIMQVARHLPANPFDFLLDHIESIVRRFCFTNKLPMSKAAATGAWTSKEQTNETPQFGVFQVSEKQQDNILKHLGVALRSADAARSIASSLFDKFVSADGMEENEFNAMQEHLRRSWGLQLTDSGLVDAALRRWRVRANAANGRRGMPLWPLSMTDFIIAFPSLLRSVRERHLPAKRLTQRELFIREIVGDIRDKYIIGTMLGQGSFGEVVLVTSKSTKQPRVCKTVHWEQGKCAFEDLMKEVDVLRSLDHPNIMRLFEYYQSDNYIQMIMEPIFGGSLSQLVREIYQDEDDAPLNRPQSLTEAWLAAALSQLLGALAYAHDVVGVMHKDLKCDNILLLGRPGLTGEAKLVEPVHVVLIDFGLAEIFAERSTGTMGEELDDGSPTRRRAAGWRSTRAGGTPPYMSPEMFRGSFGEKSDVWSLGVVMFQLMCGEFPYRGGHLMLLVQNVCCPRRHPRWERLMELRWSAGARSLCQKLLAKDEAQRPSAAEALQTHWLLRTPNGSGAPVLEPEAKLALQQVHAQSHLMRTALQCMTSQLSLSELNSLSAQFQHYDTSGNGRLSHVEVTHVLEDAGITSVEDIELIITTLDGDGSGSIEYSEFIAGCISVSSEDIRSHLRTVFEVFDLNNTGTITLDELRRALACDETGVTSNRGKELILPDGKTVEEVMKELDTNKSGQVEFQEFEQYLLAEHSKAAARRLPSKER